MIKTAQDRKAERIAKSRAALAAAYKADPDAVARFEARKARLAAAAKRERERVELLVLGGARPEPSRTVVKRRGKRQVIKTPARLQPGVDRALSLRDDWSHKQGTPETLQAAEYARTHQGALAQLVANGTIDAEQLEWAAQIANVHRSIASGVDVSVASLEARVDNSVRAPAIAERIHRVRMHAAYTVWRSLLPAPKSLALDMIVGDAIGYSVAAKRYRIHNRKAKRVLIEAIGRWPMCVAHAFSSVDQRAVDDMNVARQPCVMLPFAVPLKRQYDTARAIEQGREKTDEPYLLPAIDPAFFDDDGYFRPWIEIAAIVRERVAAEADLAA